MKLRILTALTVYLSGCSFILLDTAPEEASWQSPEAKYAHCDSGLLWPAVDGVAVIGSMVNAAFSADIERSNNDCNTVGCDFLEISLLPYGGDGMSTMFLIQGMIYGASAVYGLVQINECAAFLEHQKTLRSEAAYFNFQPKPAQSDRVDEQPVEASTH